MQRIGHTSFSPGTQPAELNLKRIRAKQRDQSGSIECPNWDSSRSIVKKLGVKLTEHPDPTADDDRVLPPNPVTQVGRQEGANERTSRHGCDHGTLLVRRRVVEVGEVGGVLMSFDAETEGNEDEEVPISYSPTSMRQS